MESDLRSLDLSRPFRGEREIYRELRWNVSVPTRFRRDASPIPEMGEVELDGIVVRHPLKINGRVFGVFHSVLYLDWDLDGTFLGPSCPPFSGLERGEHPVLSDDEILFLIDYAEKCMGLHNFDFWKVVNNG